MFRLKSWKAFLCPAFFCTTVGKKSGCKAQRSGFVGSKCDEFPGKLILSFSALQMRARSFKISELSLTSILVEVNKIYKSFMSRAFSSISNVWMWNFLDCSLSDCLATTSFILSS